MYTTSEDKQDPLKLSTTPTLLVAREMPTTDERMASVQITWGAVEK